MSLDHLNTTSESMGRKMIYLVLFVFSSSWGLSVSLWSVWWYHAGWDHNFVLASLLFVDGFYYRKIVEDSNILFCYGGGKMKLCGDFQGFLLQGSPLSFKKRPRVRFHDMTVKKIFLGVRIAYGKKVKTPCSSGV